MKRVVLLDFNPISRYAALSISEAENTISAICAILQPAMDQKYYRTLNTVAWGEHVME